MPTSTKYRNDSSLYSTRKTYKSERIYSGTGMAYDVPIENPYRSTRTIPLTTPDRKIDKKTSQEIHREKMAARRKNFKIWAAVGILFILCVTVCYRYSFVLECNQEIKALEKKRDELIAANQSAQSKIDKQLEVSEIEKYASEELGMMKPQAYQIFYIDMDMSDGGIDGTISKEAAGTVKGVPGALVNAFRVLK